MPTQTLDETQAFAINLAGQLEGGNIVAFFGDLGAGKTTLIKAIISSKLELPVDNIDSPTFTYLNLYSGSPTIAHFDLYRLQDSKQFLEKGFDEYFNEETICLIEWPERIEDILPSHTKRITLKHVDATTRDIEVVS